MFKLPGHLLLANTVRDNWLEITSSICSKGREAVKTNISRIITKKKKIQKYSAIKFNLKFHVSLMLATEPDLYRRLN